MAKTHLKQRVQASIVVGVFLLEIPKGVTHRRDISSVLIVKQVCFRRSLTTRGHKKEYPYFAPEGTREWGIPLHYTLMLTKSQDVTPVK